MTSDLVLIGVVILLVCFALVMPRAWTDRVLLFLLFAVCAFTPRCCIANPNRKDSPCPRLDSDAPSTSSAKTAFTTNSTQALGASRLRPALRPTARSTPCGPSQAPQPRQKPQRSVNEADSVPPAGQESNLVPVVTPALICGVQRAIRWREAAWTMAECQARARDFADAGQRWGFTPGQLLAMCIAESDMRVRAQRVVGPILLASIPRRFSLPF